MNLEDYEKEKCWLHVSPSQYVTVSRALCWELGFIPGDVAFFRVMLDKKNRAIGILFVQKPEYATHKRKIDRIGMRTTLRPVLKKFEPHKVGRVEFSLYEKAEPGAHLVFRV